MVAFLRKISELDAKLQLELFKNGARGGATYSHLMSRVAANLTPEQMKDASLYYASLPDDGLSR